MLDEDFFAKLGQDLTEQQKQTIAEKVYVELEDRVGEELAAKLSDQQYEQFEKIVEEGTDKDLDEWLKANAPGHEDLVDKTLEQVKQEVQQNPQKYLN